MFPHWILRDRVGSTTLFKHEAELIVLVAMDLSQVVVHAFDHRQLQVLLASIFSTVVVRLTQTFDCLYLLFCEQVTSL